VPNRMTKASAPTLFLLSSILDSSRLTAIRGTAKTVSLSRYAAHVKGLQVGPGSSVSRSESCSGLESSSFCAGSRRTLEPTASLVKGAHLLIGLGTNGRCSFKTA